MTKELLTVEFRYHEVPKTELFPDCASKTITIGIYDTISEAVKAGNEVLIKLSEKFNFTDKFSTNGFFGIPHKLVVDWSTHKVHVYCKIETLYFDDLQKVMNDVFKSEEKYQLYKV